MQNPRILTHVERLIILTESEADNVPIGEARKLWAPDALEEKEPEITRAGHCGKRSSSNLAKGMATACCCNPAITPITRVTIAVGSIHVSQTFSRLLLV